MRFVRKAAVLRVSFSVLTGSRNVTENMFQVVVETRHFSTFSLSGATEIFFFFFAQRWFYFNFFDKFDVKRCFFKAILYFFLHVL